MNCKNSEEAFSSYYLTTIDSNSMKEKGLGRSKGRNRLVTLTLLPYYMVVVTTKTNHTTRINLLISTLHKYVSVVSKTSKK